MLRQLFKLNMWVLLRESFLHGLWMWELLRRRWWSIWDTGIISCGYNCDRTIRPPWHVLQCFGCYNGRTENLAATLPHTREKNADKGKLTPSFLQFDCHCLGEDLHHKSCGSNSVFPLRNPLNMYKLSLRVFHKQPLYLHEVVIRFTYIPPSSDLTCGISLGMLLLLCINYLWNLVVVLS